MKCRIHIGDTLQSELVIIGAQEEDLLLEELIRIDTYIKENPEVLLRDIAYTCGLNSAGQPVKIAIVATSLNDLSEKFTLASRRIKSAKKSQAFTKGIYIGTDICPAPGRTVFLFPGEGSQYPDMLRDLTLHFPACRAAFDAADTTVAAYLSDIGTSPTEVALPSKWIYPTAENPLSNPGEALSSPTAIQGVIAADTALLFLFKQLEITPDAVLGIGVGELPALECAGALDVDTKKKRISLLCSSHKVISDIFSNNKLVPPCKTFSVAGMKRDELASLIEHYGSDAIIACDQTPELLTIAVTPKISEDIEKFFDSKNVTYRPLPSVVKPFHTEKLAPFSKDLEDFYKKIITKHPAVPIYSAHASDKIEGTTEEIAGLLAKQWYAPLNITKTIEKLYDDGYRVFVELGARGILTTSVASTLRHKPHLALAVNRGHRPDMLQFHHTLAALVCHGIELNIQKLHAGRNSKELDLDHPYISPSRAKKVALPRNLPTFSDIAIPKGLTAIKTADSFSSENENKDDNDPESRDFPCLAHSEIVRYSPKESIELTMRYSPNEFPYLQERALSAGRTSAYDKELRGLILPAPELLLEIMAETARKLDPEKIVTSVEKLYCDSLKDIRSEDTIRVKARILPRQGSPDQPVEVIITDKDNAYSEVTHKLASAVINLNKAYSQPPELTPLALKTPIRVDWQAEDIYPDRLYSGEPCRTIKKISEVGENGLQTECFLPPRSGILSTTRSPRFSIAPILLASASDSLAMLDSQTKASGKLHIFDSCERIDFYAPQQTEWTEYTVNIFAVKSKGTDKYKIANAELFGTDNHRMLAKVQGLGNRVVNISPEFHRQILNPLGDYFATEVPKETLPVLPHEVICCKINNKGRKDDDDEEELRMRIAAALTLSPIELERWNDLAISDSRKHEWLYGRIAAKDAVRKCLLARYGRRLGAADIRIDSDEAGKPTPQGLWRKQCGAQMDISITHTTEFIAAAAAPNASIGIDIEKKDRTVSEEFASSAFSQLEQEIAAESGDGATALFRFWCAKEALSKALGTGLRYGPGDLCARSIDQVTGKIEMEATKLWLTPFPHLRGLLIDVQTCIIDEMLLAVCVLNANLTKSENGPFIRWK